MGEGILIYGIKAGMGKAAEKIARVLSDIRRQGFSSVSPFSVGQVEKRMKDYAESHGITLGSKEIYMSSRSIGHAMRDSKKTKGLTVSESELMAFPKARRKMSLYYDGENFVYTDHKTKYVVHPNYEIRVRRNKVRKVNFITAGIVTDPNEFTMGKYKRV